MREARDVVGVVVCFLGEAMRRRIGHRYPAPRSGDASIWEAAVMMRATRLRAADQSRAATALERRLEAAASILRSLAWATGIPTHKRAKIFLGVASAALDGSSHFEVSL